VVLPAFNYEGVSDPIREHVAVFNLDSALSAAGMHDGRNDGPVGHVERLLDVKRDLGNALMNPPTIRSHVPASNERLSVRLVLTRVIDESGW
jgi:hypothetical protein